MKKILNNALSNILPKALIYFFVGGLIFVTFRTLYSPPPVESADVVIFVSNQPVGHVITEVRKFVGFQEGENVTVTRFFYDESDPTKFFQVGGGDFTTMQGEFPLLSTHILPTWVKGRWCSRVQLGWWPSWSQRSYSQQPKDVCFETSEYE